MENWNDFALATDDDFFSDIIEDNKMPTVRCHPQTLTPFGEARSATGYEGENVTSTPVSSHKQGIIRPTFFNNDIDEDNLELDFEFPNWKAGSNVVSRTSNSFIKTSGPALTEKNNSRNHEFEFGNKSILNNCRTSDVRRSTSECNVIKDREVLQKSPSNSQFSALLGRFNLRKEAANTNPISRNEGQNAITSVIATSETVSKNFCKPSTSFNGQTSNCVVGNDRNQQEFVFPQSFMSPAPALNTHSSDSAKRKRKFPGPAGLLPPLSLDKTSKLAELAKINAGSSKSPQEDVLDSIELPSTQTEENEFLQGPWLEAQKDLEGSSNFSEFNISWLLRKAALKQLPNGKMPVLIAVVKEMTVKGTDACVTLKDGTGKISGTVHRQLIEDHFSTFKRGSVIILQQVSVFSPVSRRHYLNITPKSLLCLYVNKEDGAIEKITLHQGDLRHHLDEAIRTMTDQTKWENMSSTSRGLLRADNLFTSRAEDPRRGTMDVENVSARQTRVQNKLNRFACEPPSRMSSELDNSVEDCEASWLENDDFDQFLSGLDVEKLTNSTVTS